jgi:putative mycofactocin binding protein MftB
MFDLDAQWRLNPQVALRPEPFGALLYHFGTRKLSFLKSRTMVAVVRALPEHPSAREALRGRRRGRRPVSEVQRAGRLADAGARDNRRNAGRLIDQFELGLDAICLTWN